MCTRTIEPHFTDSFGPQKEPRTKNPRTTWLQDRSKDLGPLWGLEHRTVQPRTQIIIPLTWCVPWLRTWPWTFRTVSFWGRNQRTRTSQSFKDAKSKNSSASSVIGDRVPACSSRMFQDFSKCLYTVLSVGGSLVRVLNYFEDFSP